ncbi:MAG TPA: sulfite exporter TauE/SafE family protein [Sediminibacterium sp.]|nr:sulfite exporter TauE/SafE family protein [Sediminibacterium sp.]
MAPGWLIAGLLLGLVSSMHCVGMCGPLALALPVKRLSAGRKWMGIGWYHAGRILSYSALGMVFGFIGRRFVLSGFQQRLSILLGAGLLLYFLLAIFGRKSANAPGMPWLTERVQQFMVYAMRRQSLQAMFLLGLANGLLPCGMVYFAITGALAAGNVAAGTGFMLAFGLGTFPAMFALALFGNLMGMRARQFFRVLSPYAVGILGILLIIRGLNLNIPYLSPLLPAGSENPISCH